MGNTKRILIVEDEAPLRRLFHKRLSRKGDIVDSFGNAEDAFSILDSTVHDIAIVDIKLPGIDGIKLLKKIRDKGNNTEVIIITGHGTVDSAISAMKLGAYDYLTKPCKLIELEAVVQKAYEKKMLQEANINLKDELRLRSSYDKIIGRSKKMQEVMSLVKKVASSDSTVFIEGETGTGKDLLAYEIHRQTLQRDDSFIVVHCSALPETLQESELFGYEKGAFTGAVKQKRGLVELANNGTLFVDEVGDINPQLQVKLLRFLETNKFRRLGAEQERRINARIIAATNLNLLNEVKEGRFREDLYYRLKVINISLPPLRKRKGDIPLLVDYFLKKTGSNKRFSRSALAALRSYDWPGNVRELANVVNVAVIMSSGKDIELDDLSIRDASSRQYKIKTLAQMEKEHIRNALSSCAGNKTKTAKIIGISLRNLYRKIDRYNLKSVKNFQ
ncbi:MAG: sigma-54-dependent Fis family transcriptional regulator [Deltaproteobacteria bacterium]|nr:sigma-54-dependent Fis family transcriptional regulator [Deltaproteobacteria bacterium]